MQELAAEALEQWFQGGRILLHALFFTARFAGLIVSRGGPAEADGGVVNLVAMEIELRQACGATDNQRQNTGGDGIERAQVPNFFSSGNAAEASDNVVRSPAGRFVDYDDTVHVEEVVGIR